MYHEGSAGTNVSTESVHPSESELEAAVARGLTKARDMAVSLEMGVNDAGLMETPWIGDGEGVVALMRDADDGDGEDSLIGKWVEITGTKSDLDGQRGVVIGFNGVYMVQLENGGVHELSRTNIKLVVEKAEVPHSESAVDREATDHSESAVDRETTDALLVAELEELIPSQSNEGAGGGASGGDVGEVQVPCHSCTFKMLQDGKDIVMHKTTYLYEKKQALKGSRPSRDRLVKVATSGLQHLQGLFSRLEGPSELLLEDQAHFALAVKGPGGSMVWWIGRAIQVLLPVGQRSAKVITTNPMRLEEAQRKKVKVVGSYFSFDRSDGMLTHLSTPECTDPAQYPADSILSLVELTYVGSENKYKFRADGMVSKLDGLLGALRDGEPATAAESARRGKAAAKRTADQSGANEEGAGFAAQAAKRMGLISGVSRSGRATNRATS